jgi:Uma2 family endonuclease
MPRHAIPSVKDEKKTMTAQLKPMRFTADGFIAWAAAQTRGRFELAGGEVVAMTPERVEHTRAKTRTHRVLEDAIGAAGLGCEAMGDGVTVRIDDQTVYEPDALVRCGPKTPGDATEVDGPIVVVEVVSPSSRGVDTGTELAGYSRLSSIRHYLIVQAEGRVVIHHRRDNTGVISVQVLHAGSLVLDPPDLEIEIRDIFLTL